MKQVPLLRLHEKTAAEVGEFAGWKTVITFTSVREEHSAVRNSAAIFDISHMTRTKVTGPDASNFLQKLLTVDVEKLKQRRMKYGLLLNESGNIIDDVTVYKVDENSFLMVSNAVTRDRVLGWLSQHASAQVVVEDITDFSAFFAVQGPEAVKHVSRLFGDVSGFRWFEGDFRSFDGCRLIVTRSGYTGGDGFEVMIPCGGVELYEKIYSRFVAEGVKPAGLACRDVCRIEAGFPLCGQDFDESNNPAEAGLDWAVKMDKPFFVGKDALANKLPRKKLSLLEMIDAGVPRHGYKIYLNNSEVGNVTSGCLSPLVKKGIALGYLSSELAQAGKEVYVEIRGNLRKSVVRPEPWIKMQRG